jgi:hypothetical protein
MAYLAACAAGVPNTMLSSAHIGGMNAPIDHAPIEMKPPTSAP